MVIHSLRVHMVMGSILSTARQFCTTDVKILGRLKERQIEICKISLITAASMAQSDRALDSFMAQHRPQ